MKVYFITINGNLSQYTKLEPHEHVGITPVEGCDMIIRNDHGHVFSADSRSYYATIEEAVAAFTERQRGYIDQTEQTLVRERNALDLALSHLFRV
jgi:hypothetical protein